MAVAHARLIAAGALGVAAVTVGAVVVSSGGGGEDSSAASQATRTTTVRRQDLVETEEVDGTLGYSDARTVVNRIAGTVTWTPKVGAVVHTNHRLYEVDGAPVYLLDGASPAYRTLQAGLQGDDVRQLERNLRRLGLDPDGAMDVDGAWDAGTTAAVKRWQEHKGMTESGTIEKGRIVFAPGARRIGEIELKAGSSASGGGGASSPASYEEGDARLVFAAYTDGRGRRADRADGSDRPDGAEGRRRRPRRLLRERRLAGRRWFGRSPGLARRREGFLRGRREGFLRGRRREGFLRGRRRRFLRGRRRWSRRRRRFPRWRRRRPRRRRRDPDGGRGRRRRGER